MVGFEKNKRMRAIKNSRETFKGIFVSIHIPDWNKPMEMSKDPDVGLENPYSKVSCLVVHLYSMELGSPPLYSEANRVARDMDTTFLSTLGPFLKALFVITYSAERNKQYHDKIVTGEMLGGVNNNMSGAFLLWRGA